MIVAHIAGIPAEESLGPVVVGAGLVWVCVRMHLSRALRVMTRRDHEHS